MGEIVAVLDEELRDAVGGDAGGPKETPSVAPRICLGTTGRPDTGSSTAFGYTASKTSRAQWRGVAGEWSPSALISTALPASSCMPGLHRRDCHARKNAAVDRRRRRLWQRVFSMAAAQQGRHAGGSNRPIRSVVAVGRPRPRRLRVLARRRPWPCRPCPCVRFPCRLVIGDRGVVPHHRERYGLEPAKRRGQVIDRVLGARPRTVAAGLRASISKLAKVFSAVSHAHTAGLAGRPRLSVPPPPSLFRANSASTRAR